MSATTLVHSIYGYTLYSSDDPFVLGLKEAMENGTTAALPSNFLVNLFPALVHIPEWFPGAKWKRTARKWREQKDTAVDAAYNWTKNQIANGSNEPSIVASMLNHAAQLGLEPDEVEDYVKQVAVTLFGGGTDTTTSALVMFFMAMMLFPEVQRKAQKEIDTIIGSDRLPTLEDRPKLVYVERLLTELFRWCPTLPGGFPHACYEDDVYKGYGIPRGAMVIANTWAITRNPKVYPNPEIFDPDRFLNPEVPPAPAFGFGRRLCPGIHYANAAVFITIASVLATFDIRLTQDQKGANIVPTMSENIGRVV
ncbi:hypothetical protein FRC12_012917 [Ceratobasidium sp. 428]|nr:hypothetical protein FRC12_012917 [Ceratobasidium sp. 428]